MRDGQVYVLRGNAPDFASEKNNSRQKVTLWNLMSGNGILLGSFS